ncbi:spore germination protein [Paenibacillus athensensis]|uniref:L27 domain-containing protein n=1 Tax=Paenibacillus athensensis TaxID=1967502 RepID=A0A4Y8Q1E7_9BACL|nr:spore germination protein [Paenibacillus athensensis]MCD1260643.1 spore germination protein [Paenibacillus athensensis]
MKSLFEVYEELAQFMGRPADLCMQSIVQPDSMEPLALLVYLQSTSDRNFFHAQLLNPLLDAVKACDGQPGSFWEHPVHRTLGSLGTVVIAEAKEMAHKLMAGCCLVLFSAHRAALAVPSANWNNRSVTQPERESTLIGPKDSFIEDLEVNLSMIRRRVRSETLRIEEYTIGTDSQTRIELVFMDELVNRSAIGEFRKRLQDIQLDLLLDTTQIGYLVTRQRLSPFPMFQSTERPDKAVSALMEGRFLVFCDTTPTCLILPVTMTCLYETSDDYYFPSLSGTFLRLIRMLGLAITLFLPALYIAITAVNQDVFRIQFMLAVASSREGVPYPAYIEVVIMLLLIELINEATVRLPKTIGGTATIVGGLIIGTAAAQSHLISYIMIVITATTAIGSYTAPNYMVGLAWRLCSFFLVILSIPWGLYGVVAGSALIGLYICHLDSFGVPYAAPFDTFHYKDVIRDSIIRAPSLWTRRRPSTYSFAAGGTKRKSLPEGDEW